MTIGRRTFVAGTAALAATGPAAFAATVGEHGMYGLIGTMKARPGQRDALVQVLVQGVAGMPGCLSYIVADDPTDPDLIWITEAWESKDAHDASLSLPSVRAAIAKGRPMIAGAAIAPPIRGCR